MKNEKSTNYQLLTTNYNLSFLIQTDTTVGLLSKDALKLANIKKRDTKKPFLIALSSFKELKMFTRIPIKDKRFIRRAKSITIIYPNKIAIRVVKDNHHSQFLKRFGWFYSTSANISGKRFDFDLIKQRVDIIVIDKRGFEEKKSSSLFKISRAKRRKIR